MVGQTDHAMKQASIMPISHNNKTYMNSMESKNHGYPPFLGGIGIEIPSLHTPPYSDDTKFSDKDCHYTGHYISGCGFFSVCDKVEKFYVTRLSKSLMPENF